MRTFLAIAAALFSFAASAQEIAANETVVRFAPQANPHAVTGFGGEWDPHFWRAQNVRRGCDEKAWETGLGRIRALGIGRVRMMILPDWYEPDNDNADPAITDLKAFTWDSEPMRSLCRHLDVCQKEGIRVTLTWWCAPVKRQSDGAVYWLAFPKVKQWCSAPNDPAECAENIAAALRYLIEERGYTCIDAFTFTNEPDWTFFNNDNKVEFDYYATVCRAIDARLKTEGLRPKIELDLADDSSHQGWLKQSVEQLAGVADHFNAHSYVFACEDSGYAEAMRAAIREQVAQCGDKPFSTNELGTRHYQGAYTATDVETFERAFCVAQYAIIGLNEGMTGALFWGLYDQYYYDGNNPDDGSNGGMMKTNLMAYVTENWRLRPSGQAWTLICRGAPRDAQVHPGRSTAADVDAVALVLPDHAGVNILLVNRATTPRAVKLDAVPERPRAARHTKLTVFGRDGVKELKAPALKTGSTVNLPPESVALLSYTSKPVKLNSAVARD